MIQVCGIVRMDVKVKGGNANRRVGVPLSSVGRSLSLGTFPIISADEYCGVSNRDIFEWPRCSMYLLDIWLSQLRCIVACDNQDDIAFVGGGYRGREQQESQTN